MSTTTTGAFADALAPLNGRVERVPAAEVAETIDAAAVAPAVGVPLDIDGVSLPDSVATDFSADGVESAATGVTPAALGVAEYGSLLLEHAPAGAEPAQLYPSTHVAVLRESDLYPDLESAWSEVAAAFDAGRDDAVLATGSSATADMGELVRGVHGPREVIVVLVEDR
ncbi:LUD domain-containing protein [Halocalculus aciditolerans]|uniref:Lactate utilization protein C n=1 Tax=Halocalculus aciditolerans TaxID=1383812 RepID=A0A830FFT4_9EURY|nr:LUD domain-containing protein [Halocalculus aciditolerans]GGL70285.1 lactate utilization protein C [Halocalculus aciditolerans]